MSLTSSPLIRFLHLQSHGGDLPDTGRQPGDSVDHEGVAVRQGLPAAGGSVGKAAVPRAGGPGDDPGRAEELDVFGGERSSDWTLWVCRFAV